MPFPRSLISFFSNILEANIEKINGNGEDKEVLEDHLEKDEETGTPCLMLPLR